MSYISDQLVLVYKIFFFFFLLFKLYVIHDNVASMVWNSKQQVENRAFVHLGFVWISPTPALRQTAEAWEQEWRDGTDASPPPPSKRISEFWCS